MISERISDDIFPNFPHSNAFLQFPLKLMCCKLHKATSHPTKCDVINDAGYTVANFCRYPIKHRVTKANALE